MLIVQRLIYSAMQWFVRPTEKPDVYIITAGASPPLPGIPGFQRDADNGPQDVVNGQPPGEWLFVPVEGLDLVFESAPFSLREPSLFD